MAAINTVRLRDGMIDPIAVRLLPRKIAERLDAIALFKVRDSICVAMADPQNLEHLDEIERITSLHVRPVFAFRSSIQRTLPRCYEEGFEVDTVTADMDESTVQLQADANEVDLTNVALSELSDVLAGLERAGWEIETVGPEGDSGRLVAKVRRRSRGVRICRPLAG